MTQVSGKDDVNKGTEMTERGRTNGMDCLLEEHDVVREHSLERAEDLEYVWSEPHTAMTGSTVRLPFNHTHTPSLLQDRWIVDRSLDERSWEMEMKPSSFHHDVHGPKPVLNFGWKEIEDLERYDVDVDDEALELEREAVYKGKVDRVGVSYE
nr:hypothetical protein L204_02558 [Cryptococcus depauperatus CBS 7855]